MALKIRFTLFFGVSVLIILIISAFSIYLLNEQFRRNEFVNRLQIECDKISNRYSKAVIANNRLNAEEYLSGIPLIEPGFSIYDSAGHKLLAAGFKPIPQNIIAPEKRNYTFRSRKREGIVCAYSVSNKHFFVAFIALDKFGLRKSNNLQLVLFITVFGAVLLTVLIAFFIFRQVFKPLEMLRQQMSLINEQNLTTRVPYSNSRDEVSGIAKNFNNMLDRLAQAFEMRKSFVQHASHELRTPLANMLSQTESALSTNLDETGYKQVLRSLKEDQQEMIELTNSLLLLSQYENLANLKDWTDIRIDEIIYDAIESIKGNFEEAEIVFSFTSMPENAEALMIQGSEVLIKSAIRNLLKNACQYSDDLKILINIDATESETRILFENHGSQLTAEEQQQLFVPFFRGENFMHQKGFGLGLSIVQRIVTLHKGVIVYEAKAGNINRFILTFSSMNLKIPPKGQD